MATTRVYLGTYRSGRSAAIDEFLRENIGSAVLLTPSQRHARERASQLLTESAAGGVWGDPVAPFERLAVGILAGEGVRVRLLSDVERRALLDQAVAALPGDVRGLVPSGALSTPGFLGHLLRVIERLKQAAVEPAAYTRAAAARRHGRQLDRVVAEAYARYQDLLRTRGLFDRIGVFWAAAEACAGSCPAYFRQVRHVALDGFDDFTPSQFRVLTAIAPHLDTLLFGLNLPRADQVPDVYRLQRATFEAIQVHFDVETTSFDAPPPSTALEYAADRLMQGDGCPPPPDARPNVTVVPVGSPLHEVETIARRAKALVASGTAPERIAVIYRDLAPVARLLRSVFAGAGLPATVSWQPPAAGSGVGAFTLGLVRAAEGWTGADAAALLASPWFHVADNPRDEQARAASGLLMRCASTLRSSGADPLGLTALARLAGREEGPPRDLALLTRVPRVGVLAASAAARFDALQAAAGALPAEDTLPAYARVMDELLDRLGVAPAVAAHPDPPTRAAEESALRAVRGALAALHDAYAGDARAWPRSRFAALFQRALETTPYSLPGPRGGVQCLGMQQARNLRFEHVFAGGMNEGVVPRPRAVNALLAEEDIAELRALGIALDDESRHGDTETSYVHHVLQAATESLSITWRGVNTDGKEARRSPFLVDLLALLGEGIEEAPPPPDGFVPAVNDSASWHDLGMALQYRLGDQAEAVSVAHGDFLAPALRGGALEQRRYGFETFDRFDGVLKDPEVVAQVAERFGADRVFSVSQVERYRGCPFGFFLDRVLHVEEPPDPVERFEAMERGSLVHQVLARLMRRFAGAPLAEAEWEDVEAALCGELDAAFAHETAHASPVRAALLSAERLALRRDLGRYLAWERKKTTWAPWALELGFGRTPSDEANEHNPVPPMDELTLDTTAGKVRFAGVIDRVNRDANGFHVVDYKTGALPKKKAITEGESVQLQVYIAALNRLDAEWPCVGADFAKVGRKPEKRGISQEQDKTWGDALAAATAGIGTAVQGIREGRFPPAPPGGSVCAGCPGNRACRFEKARIERKTVGNDEDGDGTEGRT